MMVVVMMTRRLRLLMTQRHRAVSVIMKGEHPLTTTPIAASAQARQEEEKDEEPEIPRAPRGEAIIVAACAVTTESVFSTSAAAAVRTTFDYIPVKANRSSSIGPTEATLATFLLQRVISIVLERVAAVFFGQAAFIVGRVTFRRVPTDGIRLDDLTLDGEEEEKREEKRAGDQFGE